ncbi:hypothetical protein [Rhizobium freirei]|uniref:hypothetical protein n=1 Tax=Rhizobium freirei TaxID=1353277 RepID=UPI0012F86989|nr:hypothetical protein [Rhizobium freirei]
MKKLKIYMETSHAAGREEPRFQRCGATKAVEIFHRPPMKLSADAQKTKSISLAIYQQAPQSRGNTEALQIETRSVL